MSAMDSPTHVDVRSDRLLLDWRDTRLSLSPASLRRHCRCTECRQTLARGGTVVAREGVRVTGATPVGAYGVQLHFSDGHERGIFPWDYLRELAQAQAGPDLSSA